MKTEPNPYDWGFLKQQCLLAIHSQAAPVRSGWSRLGDIDYERLEVSGEDAADVVIEIWSMIKGAKTADFSSSQVQEYLKRAGDLLTSDITASAAAHALREIEETIRKR
jgi:hypothetical protein